MPVRVTGAERVQRELALIRDRLVRDLILIHDETTKDLELIVRARVTRPFQSVPSYIYETEKLGRHGGPGKYPKGTIGFFALSAPAIRGTPWEGEVQLYSDEYRVNHWLAALLESETGADATEIVTEVGYGPDVASYRGSPTRYIAWVIYGTTRMQARPFLEIAQEDVTPVWLRRLFEVMAKAVGGHAV